MPDACISTPRAWSSFLIRLAVGRDAASGRLGMFQSHDARQRHRIFDGAEDDHPVGELTQIRHGFLDLLDILLASGSP